jgi:hypothetical protein
MLIKKKMLTFEFLNIDDFFTARIRIQYLDPDPYSAGSLDPETQCYSQRYNNHLCTYDLHSPVHNVLDACIYITWATGKGLGPGIREFFGPQMALAYWLDAISPGPKNS